MRLPHTEHFAPDATNSLSQYQHQDNPLLGLFAINLFGCFSEILGILFFG
jgi:hypothetical protein